MTKKLREKRCLVCSETFIEAYSSSEKQWANRLYCSMKCNNSSPKRSTSIFLRLEQFQIVKPGCWGWAGADDGNGYGKLSNRKGSGHSPEKAHRVSYEKYYGAFDKSLVVRHDCDNPECTNPKHLSIGTQKDNMRDMVSRGRINPVIFMNLNRERKITEDHLEVLRQTKFAAPNGRGGRTKKSLAEEFGVCADTIRSELRRIGL